MQIYPSIGNNARLTSNTQQPNVEETHVPLVQATTLALWQHVAPPTKTYTPDIHMAVEKTCPAHAGNYHGHCVQEIYRPISTGMQRCASSCTNGTRWPFCQPNDVIVSTQPANAGVFAHLAHLAHLHLTPLTFQSLHLALEELRIHLSCLAWTTCVISLAADSGQMALQLCHLSAELAFPLTELFQQLAHLPELLHQGYTLNMAALQLVAQLRILTAGHHGISNG